MTRQHTARWVPIDAITAWDKNPRNNDHAVEEVAKSIGRFGWGNPIIARKSDGVVIAGHTRLKAAKHLNMDKVLVRYLDLDPAEAAALAIADNKIGEIADWDDDELREILMGLDAEDVSLDGLGFTDEELNELLDDPDIDLGDNPEPIPVPEADSKPGQWYQIGPHRLYCGDCRDVDWPAAGCLIYDPPWDLVLDWSAPSCPSTLAFTDGGRASDVVRLYGAPTWVFVWDAVSSWWTPNRPLRRVPFGMATSTPTIKRAPSTSRRRRETRRRGQCRTLGAATNTHRTLMVADSRTCTANLSPSSTAQKRSTATVILSSG